MIDGAAAEAAKRAALYASDDSDEAAEFDAEGDDFAGDDFAGDDFAGDDFAGDDFAGDDFAGDDESEFDAE